MNQQYITNLSAELIMRYYDNDYMPFLEHMDDEALWYGPAEGQFLQGREKMIRVWSRDEHNLRFTMGNLKTRHISAHPSSCCVTLVYTVVTHYPDGHDVSLMQRMLLTWCERTVTGSGGEKQKEPRILVCHICNPHLKHDDDIIYPIRSHRIFPGQGAPALRGERLHFHGRDYADYFFLSDSIIWIETAASGKHSILHTSKTSMEVMSPVSKLEKQYAPLFLRCHQSFLVNPHYIRAIRRFKVELTNGEELPIPEKKYTAFRNEVLKVLKH